MATVEQVRALQEEIVDRFQTQPMHREQFTNTARRKVALALREPRGLKARRRASAGLPPPSKEVKDFLRRAFSNPNFRTLIERLAHE